MKTKLFITSVFIFVSLFSEAQTYHVDEDFNSGSLPPGWTNNAVSGTQTWSFGTDPISSAFGTQNLDSSAMAFFNDFNLGWGAINNTVELITPVFDNSSQPVTFLDFDYNYRNYTGVSDEFSVEVYDGISWVQVFSKITDDCGSYTSSACRGNFPHASIDISAYANPNCQVKFKYFDGNDRAFFVGLDNIQVFWPLPYDLSVTSLTRPGSDCSLTAADTVEVEITNYGANPVSNFNIGYSIDGGGVISEVVASTIPIGSSIIYKFNTVANFTSFGNYQLDAFTQLANDGNIANDTLIVNVQNNPMYPLTYYEDFEDPFHFWTVSGNYPSWQRGVPNGTIINSAPYGQNAFVTNLTGDYNRFEFSDFESPCLDFSSSTVDPIVSFSMIRSLNSNMDFIWMQSSIDNGLSWSKIPAAVNSINWYNESFTQTWTGSSYGWYFVENSLTGLAGQSQVKLRFRFDGNRSSSSSFEGVGLDNFIIRSPQDDDLSIKALVSPSASSEPVCGFGVEPIIIEIENKGVNAIINPVLGYQVDNNPIITETLLATIPPNTARNFTFTTPFDFTTVQSYDIHVWGSTANDQFNFNDTIAKPNFLNHKNRRPTFPFVCNWENDSNSSTYYVLNSSCGFTQDSLKPNETPWRLSSDYAVFDGSPTADNTLGIMGGNFIYNFYPSYNGSDFPKPIESPCIEIDSFVNPKLNFWMQVTGTGNSDSAKLFVDIYNGGVWSQVATFSGGPLVIPKNTWVQKSIDLSTFKNSIIKFRFRTNAIAYTSASYFLIDDVFVFDKINTDARVAKLITPENGCFSNASEFGIVLENFGLSSISNNSINVNYQVDNQPLVTETFSSSLGVNNLDTHFFATTANILTTNLFPKIKAWITLSNDTNKWNDTIVYNLKNRSTNIPFIEDFDSFIDYECNGLNSFYADTLANSWVRTRGTNGLDWHIQDATCYNNSSSSTLSSNTGPRGDNTSGLGNYMYMETSSGSPTIVQSAFLSSTCIDLTNNSSADLSFYYHKYGASMGDLFVDIESNGVWTNSVHSILGQTHTSSASNWLQANVNLNQFTGNFIRVRFRGRGLPTTNYWQGDMAIDDVSITGTLVGEKELKGLSKISISPNPSTALFNVNSSQKIQEILVRNINGKLILSKLSTANQFQIDLSNEAKGVYFVQLRTTEGVVNQKIVLQ